MAQMVKNLPAVQQTPVQSLAWEYPLEKGMAIHTSILAWRIPWTEEPGGLQSMELQSQTQPKRPTLHLECPFSVGFPGGSAGKESACNVGDLGSIPGWEDPLEKGKATHCSILAWRIPWTVEFMELQRAGHV